jgi:hypothetical protein
VANVVGEKNGLGKRNMQLRETPSAAFWRKVVREGK